MKTLTFKYFLVIVLKLELGILKLKHFRHVIYYIWCTTMFEKWFACISLRYQSFSQNTGELSTCWRKYDHFDPKWAPSSEFVSSSIPSWQILTAHAQPFRGARDLAFCLKVPLDSLFVWASSGGSGETARMRRLAWTFAARISDQTKFAWRGPISLVHCWWYSQTKIAFFSSFWSAEWR